VATSTTLRDRPLLPQADDCCTPLLRQPITASQAADLARLLKALADPTRLRLVSMVAAHEGGEACVCELTEPLGLTQPTISHHLKVLVDAGIFTRDKRGVWAYYALVPAAMEALSAVLAPRASAIANEQDLLQISHQLVGRRRIITSSGRSGPEPAVWRPVAGAPLLLPRVQAVTSPGLVIAG
jgi:ArsR family transcriptional regulator, arsenate/arsenite/antimonite-responsive transcriptional repressor